MHKVLQRFTVVSCLALAAAVAPAQTKPTFEVASVRPAAPLDRAKLMAAIQNGEKPRPGARVDGARAEYVYVTLQDLIVLAYNVNPIKSRARTGSPASISTFLRNCPTELPRTMFLGC